MTPVPDLLIACVPLMVAMASGSEAFLPLTIAVASDSGAFTPLTVATTFPASGRGMGDRRESVFMRCAKATR